MGSDIARRKRCSCHALRMAEDGAIHLAVSDAILDEVERVLRRDKFGWPKEEIDKAIRQITRFTEHVEPKQRIDGVKEDPTDNRILECAAANGSHYLVSGDKHLLKLGQYQGIKIVSGTEPKGRGGRNQSSEFFAAAKFDNCLLADHPRTGAMSILNCV